MSSNLKSNWLPVVAAVGASVVLTLAIANSIRKPIFPYPRMNAPIEVKLGQAEQGSVVRAEIRLTNEGGMPLEMRNFQTSCGCTTLQLRTNGEVKAVSDMVLTPGETVVLTMDLIVRGSMGLPLTNTIRFETNDLSKKTVGIPVTVDVVGGIRCTPQEVDFGRVLIGRESTKTVELVDTLEPARRVDRVQSSRPDLVTARLITKSLAGIDSTGKLTSERQDIEVALIAPNECCVQALVSAFSGSDSKALVELPVRANVVPPVSVNPLVIVLPRSSGSGHVYEGTCIVRHYSGENIRVTLGARPLGISALGVSSEFVPAARIEVSIHPDLLASREKKGSLPMTAELQNGAKHGVEVRVKWQ